MMQYFILIAALVSPALSYSTGAPQGVCDTLTPHHGDLKTQDTSAPYTLEITGNPGQPFAISLKGNGPDDVIKGFIIQARINNKPVGQFVAGGNSQVMECSAKGDTLTHTKIITNINKIDAQWIPSNNLKGKDVNFVVTVVKRGDIFWVNKLNKSVTVN